MQFLVNIFNFWVKIGIFAKEFPAFVDNSSEPAKHAKINHLYKRVSSIHFIVSELFIHGFYRSTVY